MQQLTPNRERGYQQFGCRWTLGEVGKSVQQREKEDQVRWSRPFFVCLTFLLNGD